MINMLVSVTLAAAAPAPVPVAQPTPMAAMDHSKMNHSKMDHSKMTGMDKPKTGGMDCCKKDCCCCGDKAKASATKPADPVHSH